MFGAGEREPMLVMRDALLSQLHMALLRQEIIEAELAKIERDMALRAAIGGHQMQTMPMPMPMPWHDMATTDAGPSQPWPFSAKQPMAGHNAEFDEHKLPDSNKVSSALCFFFSSHVSSVLYFCFHILAYCSELCTSKPGLLQTEIKLLVIQNTSYLVITNSKFTIHVW
jgi:hypothetical protein